MRWIGMLLVLIAGRAIAAPAIASYTIEARLDPVARTVTGKQTLRWKNPGTLPVRDLVFHLYMNAFGGEGTRFARESGGHHRSHVSSESERGGIVVKRLALGTRDLVAQLVVDETLATVRLPTPVLPGATVELELEFVTTLPRIWARTGFADRFFAIGQWFPKIAVYECPAAPGCGFVAQQLHAWTEFYSDFGTYEVTVDVPADHLVAGVGVVTRDAQREGRRRVTFSASDVHDFAWFASPELTRYTSRVEVAGRTVELELFAGRGARASVERHLEAARTGIVELATFLPAYPYPKLTIVLPPAGAEGAGGMEYPTLITGFASPSPPFLRVDELVTLHELTHQYFYGLVASNEPEEAWLDEGLTEFVSSRLLDEHYGGIFALGPLRVTMSVGHWLAAVRQAAMWPVAIPAYAYPTGSAYSATTYSKTAQILHLWEQRLGRAELDRRLGAYAQRHLYRHPKRADFVAALAMGSEERQLLDALLSLDQPLDYAIVEVSALGPATQAIVQRTGPPLAEATVRAHARDGSFDDHVWSRSAQQGQATWTLALPKETDWVEVISPLSALDAHPANDARRKKGIGQTANTLERWSAALVTVLLALVGT